VNTDLKAEWNWYSTNNEQQNAILWRHFVKNSSKSIHYRQELFHVAGKSD
jgi:hypothetical protein